MLASETCATPLLLVIILMRANVYLRALVSLHLSSTVEYHTRKLDTLPTSLHGIACNMSQVAGTLILNVAYATIAWTSDFWLSQSIISLWLVESVQMWALGTLMWVTLGNSNLSCLVFTVYIMSCQHKAILLSKVKTICSNLQRGLPTSKTSGWLNVS